MAQYEDQTEDVIRERMLDRVDDSLDKRPSSLIYDTHSPTAIELAQLYVELDTIIENSYGDTASRDFLILRCKERGITPEPATNAVLKGVFTPASVNVSGQRFNIGTINYVVSDKIADGEYKVTCETAGTIGNTQLGTMIPMAYIAGLETAELTELLIPGEDEEDTEALRQRYFDSLKDYAFGGNRADYIAKVNAIDGVGACKVTRCWNGGIRPADMIPSAAVDTWYNGLTGLSDAVKTWLTAVYTAAKNKYLTVGGTVGVTIVDSDDFGEASATLINTVQTTLDPVQNAGEGEGLAPFGHVVNVASASAVQIYVTCSLAYDTGYSWSNLSDTIKGVVQDYLLELRKTWADNSALIVRVSQIEARILGVDGVADITGTRLNGSASNLVLDAFEIPVFGGVN